MKVENNTINGRKKIIMDDIREEGVHEIKIILKDDFLARSYKFFIIFKYPEVIPQFQPVMNFSEVAQQQTKCDMNLCKNDRICLECNSKGDLSFGWIYEDKNEEWWSLDQKKK